MAFKMSDKAQTIKIYNLRADTKEFIGAGDAYIPPHTGLPADSTDIAPPEIPEGHIAVFDPEAGTWRLTEDHRGETVYDTKTGHQMYIADPGPLPEHVTTLPPDGEYRKWDGEKWVVDAEAERNALIAEAAARKKSLLQQAGEVIATLQDAVDLGMATKEEEQRLVAWKKYRVLLSRINPEDAPDIVWPVAPEM
ncbi:tail fiber assembly protein [Salmonella enterica]|nr:tail fiber assembly protein [Salmonella enterica subsp. enterica serovar Sandiego]EGK3350944.1 tail fiber assembly protein [Salmonella enterica]EHK3002038.1 tail fiber assembly protein [Salmonella enterica subsp. enterica serovar Poona]